MPSNELEILSPDVILKQAMGYDYISSSNYGVKINENEFVNVAGVIDQPNKIVAISNNFPVEVQKFTAAHELGHAILHKQPILHRDIPAHFAGRRGYRNRVESEADKFATFFLMPTKWVKIEFVNRYGKEVFLIDENSSFKFGGRSIGEIRNECKNLHGLARKLSSSESFDGKRFRSLAKMFNVSIEAMAIRLEELDLLEY